MRSIRTLIVDDYPPFRHVLKAFLAFEPEVEFVGEADSVQGAIAKAEELAPDVVLMDIGLTGLPTLEALRRIKAQTPNVKVIVLLEEDDQVYRNAALKNGADLCVAKESAYKELLAIMKAPRIGRSGTDLG